MRVGWFFSGPGLGLFYLRNPSAKIWWNGDSVEIALFQRFHVFAHDSTVILANRDPTWEWDRESCANM